MFLMAVLSRLAVRAKQNSGRRDICDIVSRIVFSNRFQPLWGLARR
jgi:hypothetical protein